MKRFKHFLRRSVQESFEGFQLQVGQPPRFKRQGHYDQHGESEVVDIQLYQDILGFLQLQPPLGAAVGGEVSAPQVDLTRFEIPKIGEVYVVADFREPASLEILLPPNGLVQAEQVRKQRLQHGAVALAEPQPLAEPKPVVAPAPLPVPEPLDQHVQQQGAPQLSSEHSQVTQPESGLESSGPAHLDASDFARLIDQKDQHDQQQTPEPLAGEPLNHLAAAPSSEPAAAPPSEPEGALSLQSGFDPSGSVDGVLAGDQQSLDTPFSLGGLGGGGLSDSLASADGLGSADGPEISRGLAGGTGPAGGASASVQAPAVESFNPSLQGALEQPSPQVAHSPSDLQVDQHAPKLGQVATEAPAASEELEAPSGPQEIDRLLKAMVQSGASDLHLTIGEPVIHRIDGDIQRVQQSPPLSKEDLDRYVRPIMPKINAEEFQSISDTDFAYEVPELGRFRVNVFRNRFGMASVLRHIPADILTAEQLGLPPAIRSFCQLGKGLVVVTGPTGSGKSTTLAAMIDLINKTRKLHVLTVEDPVEFVHQPQQCLINQREVHTHTQSFSRALKAALREDPDVILIGEMRDLETVAIAIETAETGHLVFGTLHTNTAVSTIDRIIDQFSSDQQEQIRTMLSSSLKGVVAQTLVKKPEGGRLGVHEILVTDDAVASMIREGKNHMIKSHMVSQKGAGNVMLNDSLLKLVKEGKVDLAEAYLKAIDKQGFIDSGKRMGLPTDSL